MMPNMTRREAIEFAMDAYAIPRDEAEEMFDEYLDSFEQENARRTCLKPDSGAVALDTLCGFILLVTVLVEIVIVGIGVGRML